MTAEIQKPEGAGPTKTASVDLIFSGSPWLPIPKLPLPVPVDEKKPQTPEDTEQLTRDLLTIQLMEMNSVASLSSTDSQKSEQSKTPNQTGPKHKLLIKIFGRWIF